jgi:hypothetical protein
LNEERHFERTKFPPYPNLPPQEEDKENKNIESKKHGHSSLQGLHHWGPKKYFNPKIDMRNFNGNDPIIWIL